MNKLFIVLSTVLLAVDCKGEFCFNEMEKMCKPETELTGTKAGKIINCSATFGGFVNDELRQVSQDLVATHLSASFKYLLMGSHFSQWQINRPGFHEYFTGASDQAWDEATKLMQQIVIRGGGKLTNAFHVELDNIVRLEELEALSKALDIEKERANKTLKVLEVFTHGNNRVHDGAFANILAEDVNENRALRIKHLVNHVHSLSQSLLSSADKAFVLHMYDELLKS